MKRDPIDELLDGPDAIPDDGFTRRVMASLPPAQAAPWRPQRWLAMLAAGAVAAALTPDAVSLAGWLAAGSASLGGGLASALGSQAGAPGISVALPAVLLALAGAAVGSWLVAERA